MTDPQTQEAPSRLNIANALTVLRLVLVPVFIWLMVESTDGDDGMRWWATAVFVVATFTDWLDGMLARQHNLITNFGKIADPIADKALVGAALIALSALGELWWWVTIVILARELAITVVRFVVIRYGVMAASRGGKLKTLLQTLGLTILLLPLGGWVATTGYVVMGAAVVVTVVTFVDYLLDAWRLWRTGRAEA